MLVAPMDPLAHRQRRHLATLASLAWLACACAEAYDVSADEADAADAAFVTDAARTGDAAPAMTAAPQVGAIPPGGCVPGLCLTCDPEGRVTLPASDPNCPHLQCGDLDTFSQRAEGDVIVCDRAVHVGEASNCASPGVCRAQIEAAACQAPRTLEQSRTTSPCQVMAGCAGTEAGSVTPAPAGRPCAAGTGLCREDGTCDQAVSETCQAFVGLQVCDEGVHVTGDPYCDVANVAGANCITTCVGAGGVCLAAFEATADAPCAEGAATGCAAALPQLRCRCRNPG